MTIIYNDKPSDPPPPYSESQEASTSQEPPNASVSRETIIKTRSDSIKSPFKLLDLLDLSTLSGSIDVSVTPAPDATSAVFNASTLSGKITATFVTSAPAAVGRDLRTAVESKSGSIRGIYILGSKSAFKTLSGKIDVTLLAKAGVGGAELVTHGASGRQDIRVVAEDGSSLRDMNVRCENFSGHVDLKIPFEGVIRARSTSGSITVEGRGVTVEKDTRAGLRRVVEARAGKGDGRIDVSTVSGSIKIVVD